MRFFTSAVAGSIVPSSRLNGACLAWARAFFCCPRQFSGRCMLDAHSMRCAPPRRARRCAGVHLSMAASSVRYGTDRASKAAPSALACSCVYGCATVDLGIHCSGAQYQPKEAGGATRVGLDGGPAMSLRRLGHRLKFAVSGGTLDPIVADG